MNCFERGGSVRTLAVVAAVAAVWAAGAAPVLARKPNPKLQIKFATLAPEGSTWMKIMHEYDGGLREATENRMGFKFYPGGVQGDEKDVLRKMRNGQIHAGGFTGMGLGAIASEFRALEVPFMFRNFDEVDYVRKTLGPYFEDLFEQKGYLFLGWADVGFVYISSNRPITSPLELQQAKMWTWSGDQLAELFFRAFDVSPIPLALPDVLTSLQMGVVDAVYCPPLACVALQWFTRVKYMSDVPIGYAFGAMLVSKRALAKASPEDVAVLKRLARKHSEVLVAKTRTQNLEAIEAVQSEGVKLLTVDEEMKNLFFTTGRGAWKDGIGKLYPAELLERVSSTVDEYRAGRKEARQ
ncbi:MAG: TRAP transporter substrate-binding protein DctP [Candidatus Krumholzibacteriia bacterium]